MTASVIGGLIGGLVGAAAMSLAHTVVTAPREETATVSQPQEEDATVKVAEAVTRLWGRSLTPEQKPLAGSLVHYAFGTVSGAAYGAAATVLPWLTIGHGLGLGVAMWLGAHALVVPTLGLAPSPLRQPPAKEALEFVLHLLYGVVTETVRRVTLKAAG